MTNETKLTCRQCEWAATLGTTDPPTEPSQAAIDHYLVFGHTIERVNGERKEHGREIE